MHLVKSLIAASLTVSLMGCDFIERSKQFDEAEARIAKKNNRQYESDKVSSTLTAIEDSESQMDHATDVVDQVSEDIDAIDCSISENFELPECY